MDRDGARSGGFRSLAALGDTEGLAGPGRDQDERPNATQQHVELDFGSHRNGQGSGQREGPGTQQQSPRSQAQMGYREGKWQTSEVSKGNRSASVEQESPRIDSTIHRADIDDESDSRESRALIKQESCEKESRELSTGQTLGLWILMLFMGSQLTLPFALAVFMVREIFNGEGSNEQKIAQLTGFLAAAQSFARSITSFPWGMASDAVGRKIVMLIGVTSSIVSLLCFGSSRSYTGAILSRFLPSLLVGTAVASKSMIGDVCNQVGQAKAMTVFSLGHGVGSVIGPILGGVLSYPCQKMDIPGCSADGIFQTRPFFLPCLVIAGVGLCALLSTCLLLKETQSDVVNQPGGWVGNLFRVIFLRSRTYTSLSSEEALEVPNSISRGKQDVEMGDLHAKELIQAGGKSLHNQEDNSRSMEIELQKLPDAEFRWYKDPSIRHSLIGAGLIALILNFLDEVSPIFVSAPLDRGGLKMTLEQFTWPLGCGGLALAIFALTMYHRLVKWIGPIKLCRAGLLAGIIPCLLLPTASLFAGSKIVPLVFVYAAITFRGPAKICALNSSIIVVNQFAGKKTMGRVNGAAMTLQSGGRALGPLLSGTAWAVSVSLDIPGQQFLSFILVALALVSVQFLYSGLQLPENS